MLSAISRNSCGVIQRRNTAALICIALSLTLSGCGGPRNKPVKVDLAKTTLVQVLDHWKSGGAIDELQKRSPKIVVQEMQWSNGAKLQEYRITGEGRAEDASWWSEVELTLVPPAGGEPTKKNFTYIVGTDPVLTVFRAVGL